MGFFDKVNEVVQSGVDKSKELADTTKLNLSIASAEDSIKSAKAAIGSYVVDHDLLRDDEQLKQWYDIIDNKKASIEADKKAIDEIKSSTKKCPFCGAVLEKDSKFCANCGKSLQ